MAKNVVCKRCKRVCTSPNSHASGTATAATWVLDVALRKWFVARLQKGRKIFAKIMSLVFWYPKRSFSSSSVRSTMMRPRCSAKNKFQRSAKDDAPRLDVGDAAIVDDAEERRSCTPPTFRSYMLRSVLVEGKRSRKNCAILFGSKALYSFSPRRVNVLEHMRVLHTEEASMKLQSSLSTVEELLHRNSWEKLATAGLSEVMVESQ